MQIEIATPQKYLKFDDLESCSAPGVLGQFQVLTKHAPFVSELTVGHLTIKNPKGIQYFSTSGGFLQIVEDVILCLLDTCEEGEEIDVSRAEAAAERARERLEQKKEDIDIDRARAALFRATSRLKISEKLSERV